MHPKYKGVYDDAKINCNTGLEEAYAQGKYAGWAASDVVDGVVEVYEEKIAKLNDIVAN